MSVQNDPLMVCSRCGERVFQGMFHLCRAIPGFRDGFYGRTCQNCGAFVYSGDYHWCSTVPQEQGSREDRILAVLERIEKKLDRLLKS